MSTVSCPGLSASNPMAVMAALGALDLLNRYVDPAATLAWWRDGLGWSAHLDADGADDVDALAALVAEALVADSIAGLSEFGADINKVTPQVLRTALLDDERALLPATRVLATLITEFPRREDGQAARHPLVVVSFEGRRNLFQAAIRSDRPSANKVAGLLAGSWHYVKEAPTLNWDPDAREQDSARLGVDASADKGRGAAGSLALALRGCSLLPLLPSHGRRANTPAVVDDHFVWPIWADPLGRAAVESLFSRSWARSTRTGARGGGGSSDNGPRRRMGDEAIAGGCSVVAVWASKIVDAKDGRRLAHGRALQ